MSFVCPFHLFIHSVEMHLLSNKRASHLGSILAGQLTSLPGPLLSALLTSIWCSPWPRALPKGREKTRTSEGQSAPKGPLEWHQEASTAHLGGSLEAKVKTGHHDFPETGCPCFSVASLHGNHRKINHGLRDRENFLWLIFGQGCTFSQGCSWGRVWGGLSSSVGA